MKKYYALMLLAVGCMAFAGSGCAYKQRMLVGLDDYTKNPAAYTQYEVVISATIDDVLNRYDDYRNKRIQLTAPFEYFGDRQFWTWYVMLNENDKKLRCYTHHYRIHAEWDAENLLMWARAEKQPVTINGMLYRDGIDILEIIYRDQLVRPNVKPARAYPLMNYHSYW
jgi:hypothetical protein